MILLQHVLKLELPILNYPSNANRPAAGTADISVCAGPLAAATIQYTFSNIIFIRHNINDYKKNSYIHNIKTRNKWPATRCREGRTSVLISHRSFCDVTSCGTGVARLVFRAK